MKLPLNEYALKSIKRALESQAKASPISLEDALKQTREIQERYGGDTYLENLKIFKKQITTVTDD